MPSRTSGWLLTLRRRTGFLRALLRSKMAIVGLILLIGSIVTALAAPMLTPYDPQRDIVAGASSPPGWMTYFSEGSRLSQNMVLETRPDFPDAATFQGWQFSASDPARTTAAYDPGASFSAGSGSVRITLDRSSLPTGNYTATFKKTLTYPYSGPPSRFAGTIAVLTQTASQQEPVRVTVFIERVSDGRRWELTNSKSWVTFPSTDNKWQIPNELIDSNSDNLKLVLGTAIDPAQLIISSKDDYSYGAIVTFTNSASSTQPLTVNLDDMALRLYGTAWGLLGTDATGLDVFSQLVYGARVSLLVGLLSAFIGIGLGLLIGMMAGYLGKLIDEVLMRFTDMLLVIPSLPLLIVLVAVLGTKLGSSRLPALILVIGFLGWMGFARVVRSQVLSLKERPFVEAAKAAGAGTGHITTKHIIPNIVGLIYVNLALAVPGAILTEAALSFLGLGDTTVMSWGRMLHDVQLYAGTRNWWWVIPPGLSIALVSLSFVLIGYSLDEIFNPKLRRRR